jgi:predicted HD superfamily hydrolase involved in NAD metabolism
MYMSIYWKRICINKMFHEIRKYIEINLTPLRLEHSLSTALICVELCSRFGLDETKGRIVGIGHDISRETPVTDDLISLIDDGYIVSNADKLNPVLLHGRIGANLLKEEFKLDDDEILQAVRWHTTGHPEMGKLGQVLFIADYIEPGRSHISPALREKYMQMDLNEMTLKVLNDQSAFLRDNGYRITEQSIQLYEKLSTLTRT